MVAKSEAQGSASRDVEIEPGEREPLGILIKRLPLRSSGMYQFFLSNIIQVSLNIYLFVL